MLNKATVIKKSDAHLKLCCHVLLYVLITLQMDTTPSLTIKKKQETHVLNPVIYSTTGTMCPFISMKGISSMQSTGWLVFINSLAPGLPRCSLMQTTFHFQHKNVPDDWVLTEHHMAKPCHI